MKNPEAIDPTFLELSRMTEDEVRQYLESIRWPTGAVCPHCTSREVTALHGTAHRAGLYKCKAKACRKQFTVSVGTIFHRSHVPLRTWAMAFAIVCASKKGVSALQLQRQLDLGSYQTAWHLAHRIRHAMAHQPMQTLLQGRVEVDETYIGGKPRPFVRPTGKSYGWTKKVPVVALIERDGKMRAHHVKRVNARTLRTAIEMHVSKDAILNTDEAKVYKRIGRRWPGGHEYVRHASEYAIGPNHINSAESFFALMKRGIHGAFHHVSVGHLQRYVDEFQFRWNARGLTDAERTRLALGQGDGCRLTYRPVAS